MRARLTHQQFLILSWLGHRPGLGSKDLQDILDENGMGCRPRGPGFHAKMTTMENRGLIERTWGVESETRRRKYRITKEGLEAVINQRAFYEDAPIVEAELQRVMAELANEIMSEQEAERG